AYYGFGMGAASYVQGLRFTRPRQTQAYYQWVTDLMASRGVIDGVPTPPDEVLLDTLMLGLRLADGVSLSALAKQFGQAVAEQVWQCLQPYVQRGWVEMPQTASQSNSDQLNDRIRLKDPEGFLFSNVVLIDLFEVLGGHSYVTH
ncbi:MAG: coproporphyrinogen III oxidase, partial [Cyanothece sp. SIO1E1]|nr:coproporphyrinogen III oxidase [Cyanothece sp. SIO1E1]